MIENETPLEKIEYCIDKEEWRCYHFGNFYLSPIQQGIQSAHAQMELFNNYCPNIFNNNEVEDTPAIDMLFTWSNQWKTMICLNGGDNLSLTEIKDELCVPENPYPNSYFNESEAALNGVLTNVAIVLPKRIFGTAEALRSGKFTLIGNDLENKVDDNSFGGYRAPKIDTFSDIEVKIIEILNSCGLAR